MNTEPRNNFRADPLPDPAMDDADYQKVLDAARAYCDLGLFAEAEAELISINVPTRWHDRFESARCGVAYAVGDLEKVIGLGFARCHREALQPPNDYIMLATALHTAGRWREAVVINQLKIHRHGARPSDYYGIACYYGRALQMEKTLSNLVTGLGDYPNYLKALVDSDLQPFWTRLASLKHTPEVLEALRSPALSGLSRMTLRETTGLVWDPLDTQALPPGFGRWIVTGPDSLNRMLSDGAPAQVKLRFKQWILARARANQHILRQAVQAARLHYDSLWNDPKYAKYSTKKVNRYTLTDRARQIFYDQLRKLYEETTDPALRQEYHEELLDLAHSALIATMLEDDEDDFPPKTR